MPATLDNDPVTGLIDVTLDPDIDSLHQLVREFLADLSPEERVRAIMQGDEGHDPAVWTALARELEVTGLLVPADFGGAGCTQREMLAVLEEMGYALYPGPFLASAVLATTAILGADDDAAQHRLLPGLADGSLIGAVALPSAQRGGQPVRATRSGEGFALTGIVRGVLDGHLADVLLVAAWLDDRPDGPFLFEVRGGQPGCQQTRMPTLDQTRNLADIELNAARATLLGTEGCAGPLIDTVLDNARLAIAAEQLGGARRCLDEAVGYAKTREQFGRPIGSFQAIKHKCADMLLHVERARSALAYVGRACADGDLSELPLLAPLLKSTCSEAYLFTAGQNIQIHGGIGFAWEHPAHLHLKRAHTSATLFGDVRAQRALLADRIGL
ncbi:MAG TPA: acyl-CoA dehydrogenase family protein [Pseudonocardia sp.]|jgi:alkylation response protein AidB-like acyl-CoA dehydrogenase